MISEFQGDFRFLSKMRLFIQDVEQRNGVSF